MKKILLIVTLMSSFYIYSVEKFAVVIGNSEYDNISDLPIAKNDVVDVSNKFKELGYIVSTLVDQDRESIESFLNSLKDSLTEDSLVILYYAGHGVQVDGVDYILCHNVTVDQDQFKNYSIPISTLIKSLYASKSSTMLLFLDSCRNNPFVSSGSDRGMTVISKDVNTKLNKKKKIGIIHSTNSGKTAYDAIRGFRNSPFTTAFLSNISVPSESLSSLLTKISMDVGLHTKGTQKVDSELDFKDEVVLNTTAKAAIFDNENYNSLVVKGYGSLFVKALDPCVVTINNGAEYFFDIDDERSFDYQVGTIRVKLAGDKKIEELKLEIKENVVSKVVFLDLNSTNNNIDTYNKSAPKGSSDRKELDMVLVEPGQFIMGSNRSEVGRSSDEKQHSVTLTKPFYISKYEVTNDQYCFFLNENKNGIIENWIDIMDSDCHIKYKNGEYLVESGFENFPVVEVSWYGAREYCEWVGGTLPTEAQWEYAAKGGHLSSQFIFSGSNVAENVGWVVSNSEDSLHTVGSKEANELGLFDMSGNALEWCLDSYKYDYDDRTVDPHISSIEKYKVLRGGSWSLSRSYARSAKRINDYPVNRSYAYGFRLVKN